MLSNERLIVMILMILSSREGLVRGGLASDAANSRVYCTAEQGTPLLADRQAWALSCIDVAVGTVSVVEHLTGICIGCFMVRSWPVAATITYRLEFW